MGGIASGGRAALPEGQTRPPADRAGADAAGVLRTAMEQPIG